MTIFGAIVFASFLLTGCVIMQSTTISDINSLKGETVSAKAGGVGWLFLTLPDQARLEQQALNELKGKGATKNITSRLAVRHWFGIIQYYSVKATGEK